MLQLKIKQTEQKVKAEVNKDIMKRLNEII